MIDFRAARPLPARYYSFLGCCGDEPRDRYARRSVAARKRRSAGKANRNFLRLFNRPRPNFLRILRTSPRRGAERRGAGAAAAGWYLARPVSLVFFSNQRETSENSPRRSHAAGDFQRILPRAIRNPLSRKHFVPEIYLLETSSESIEFYSEFYSELFSEMYWISVPHLKTPEMRWIFAFALRTRMIFEYQLLSCRMGEIYVSCAGNSRIVRSNFLIN